jgi:hypothetical protein
MVDREALKQQAIKAIEKWNPEIIYAGQHYAVELEGDEIDYKTVKVETFIFEARWQQSGNLVWQLVEN